MRPKPSLRQFRELVREVLDELPEPFLRYMENLVIDVEAEPSEADLKHAAHPDRQPSDESELFGIFHGTSPFEEGAPDHPMNRIVIFRGPHVRNCRTPRELRRQIRATVLHELAHHFGFSEDDLKDFESRHQFED